MKNSLRLARPVKKQSLTGTIWKRSLRGNRANRKKKSGTCVTWGIVSNGRDQGKRQRCAYSRKEVIDVLMPPGKIISDMRNLGKNQQRVRLGKESAMCATWKRNQQRARPVKKVSDVRNLKKISGKDSCELAKNPSISTTWKKISDERNIKKKVSDERDLWKSIQRRAQPEKIMSDGLVRTRKKSATCVTWWKCSYVRDLWKNSATGATWKRSQRKTR